MRDFVPKNQWELLPMDLDVHTGDFGFAFEEFEQRVGREDKSLLSTTLPTYHFPGVRILLINNWYSYSRFCAYSENLPNCP